VTGVDLGAVEEITVSRVKQIMDGRQVVATVAQAFAATQNRVKARTISRPTTHSRPWWRRILDPGNDSGAKYVVQRCHRNALRAQDSHRVQQTEVRRQ